MSVEGEPSRDWGNVRFRTRRAVTNRSRGDEGDTRLVTAAVLFVVVALAYPWYSYWVHSRLLARDMREVAGEFDKQARQLETAVSTRLQTLPPPHSYAPTRTASAPIRVMGVSEGTSGAVLVAQLGNSSLADARDSLCFQASRWTRRSTDGRTFRVQRYRGNAPATHAGSIRC
jgi:hypothetical protein